MARNLSSVSCAQAFCEPFIFVFLFSRHYQVEENRHKCVREYGIYTIVLGFGEDKKLRL
jgi:hypothetical protein